MKRIAFFGYGLVCYLMFFAVYVYLCAFVGNYFVPKTIDAPTGDPIGLAVAIDLGLIALFCLQHSVMARPAFKRVWTRMVTEWRMCRIRRAASLWIVARWFCRGMFSW